MPTSNSQMQPWVPAVIIGIAVLVGSFMIKGSLERVADQLDGVRLGLADTKQSLERLAQARPAERPTPAAPVRRGPDPEVRYEVDTAGAPTKGPANAPVKIVEFSDFQ